MNKEGRGVEVYTFLLPHLVFPLQQPIAVETVSPTLSQCNCFLH